MIAAIDRIGLVKLDSGIVNGKLPVNVSVKRIPTLLPCSDLCSEGRCIIYPAVETLSLEYTNFDFCHVQPTSSLGGEIELELIEVFLCHFRREKLIECSRLVCVELIHHYPDADASG